MKRKKNKDTAIYTGGAVVLGASAIALMFYRRKKLDEIEANYELDRRATDFAKNELMKQVALGTYRHLDPDQIQSDFTFYKMMYRNKIKS